jgi:sugar phosphate permease
MLVFEIVGLIVKLIGSGSLGAAFGPLMTGLVVGIYGWSGAFGMWVACNALAALPLVGIVIERRSRSVVT